MDVCSYQYEQWYSMDRLYMPKNLWVNHSTHWTRFYSLQREIHLHKVEKTKNPNRIQINCSSSFVVSPNFLKVRLWLSYVSWCFHDRWAYLIVINFRHILKPFRDFECLRWWRPRCWCTFLPMGINDFPYGVSLSTRIPFSNDLAKPRKKSFSSGAMSHYFAYLYLTAYIEVIAVAPSVTMIVFINSDCQSKREIGSILDWVGIDILIYSEHKSRELFNARRGDSDKPWSAVSARNAVIPGRAIARRIVLGSSPREAKVTSRRMQMHDTTWLELEPSCRSIVGITLTVSNSRLPSNEYRKERGLHMWYQGNEPDLDGRQCQLDIVDKTRYHDWPRRFCQDSPTWRGATVSSRSGRQLKAEFKSGCKSFEPLNLSMYLMTHWPHRQLWPVVSSPMPTKLLYHNHPKYFPQL